MKSKWAARIDELRALAERGLSAAQIAEAMGATKNQIIGACHRLGVRLTYKAPPKPKVVRETRARTRNVTHAPRVRVAPFVVKPRRRSRPVTLMQLEPQHCRWPIGDPREKSFRFCGDERKDEHPYCGAHFRVAYRHDAPRYR